MLGVIAIADERVEVLGGDAGGRRVDAVDDFFDCFGIDVAYLPLWASFERFEAIHKGQDRVIIYLAHRSRDPSARLLQPAGKRCGRAFAKKGLVFEGKTTELPESIASGDFGHCDT